jgi:hypothetical protein
MKFSLVNKDKLLKTEHRRLATRLLSMFKESYAEALMIQLGLRQDVIDQVLMKNGRIKNESTNR